MGKTVKDFSRKQIAMIAKQYVESSSPHAHTKISEEQGISDSTFYNILKKAVVENVVDMETVRLMAQKAMNNSEAKAGRSARKRSFRYYQGLLVKRMEYIPPKGKAKELTKAYADTEKTKEQFIASMYVTEALLNRTILKCIVENWVSDEVVLKLKEKSLEKDSSSKVQEFWEQVEALRIENQKT